MSAPRAEIAHWITAAAILFVGLLLLAEAIVGPEVFRRRAWRAYAWPVAAVVGGVFLWLIAALSTFSTLHLIAHSLWAQAAMIAGGVQIAVIRGSLTSPRWSLVTAAALFLTGASFLIHEQNGWLFSRSAFLHHLIGWVLVASAVFPVGQALRPRRLVWSTGFALTFVVVAILLFADRDVAPIFGHLSEFAGGDTP
ncbi:MAG: hypothetical protein OEW31_08205 [Thermoleophilia bacterium]|nr:hypothetical protein [Thermoleophilia bacterium]MDH4346300.1 hypothetical protein [Thermoleophilia bacterium]MDH5334027.1 hypothetical protein [Thermoleophilia bacterium]